MRSRPIAELVTRSARSEACRGQIAPRPRSLGASGLQLCEVCRELMRDGQRIFHADPLAFALGEVPDNRTSRRIQARAHARWMISHLEHDVIDLAVSEHERCGEALLRIGRPR